MTNEQLYHALIVERFHDVEQPPEVRPRPISHGGPDTDRACSTRRRALSRAMKRGERDE